MAPEEREKTDFSIGIQKGDVLIPVCHAGQNRSQMMYALLWSKEKNGWGSNCFTSTWQIVVSITFIKTKY